MATQAPVANLEALVDRLVALPSSDVSIVSLYLDARPDAQGKHRIEPHLSRELRARRASVPASHRASYDRDLERIASWVRDALPRSARAAVCFAADAAGLFEALPLDMPVESHSLHVGPRPHVYPLLHLLERYRRYAAVVADTSYTRIFVFGLNRTLAERDVAGVPKKSMDAFTTSQARFQRHVAHEHHRFAKEVADTLERILREEGIDDVILAGDEVALPLIRAALSPTVRSKVIEALHLDVRAPEHQVLRATLDAFQRHDAHTDAEKVQRVMDEFRAGGLGVVGARDTRLALEMGQVDELLIAADATTVSENEIGAETSGDLAEDLVARARGTDARVSFVEDPMLLRDVGGVAALLRFRVSPRDGGSTVS